MTAHRTGPQAAEGPGGVSGRERGADRTSVPQADAQKRVLLAPIARAELARRRFGDFLHHVVPGYESAPHTRMLVEHLEALERRELGRLVVTMPPRHGKTLHVSQAFPAWAMGRRPAEHVILASYGAELAEQNSRRTRGFLLDPRWPFPDVAVSAESSAVGRWHTTAGGGCIAAGIGGGLTGHGAHLLIVDDPVRGREDADSAAVRESTWRWWTEVALTRLQPGAAVLLVQTRWHEDDLAGRVLDSPGAADWTVLSLPALADDGDPLGRAEGEALWPDWYDAAHLESLRVDIGERAFAALYQQRPTPDRGGIFQRAWLDGRYDRLPEGLRVVQAVDASFKTGTANDYSAIVTVATDGRRFYVADVWRQKVEFPQLVAAIKAQAAEWNPEAILIEDAAAGQSATQQLRRDTALPIVAVKPSGSKIARAESVSPLFESGRVLLPSSAGWLGAFVEELASFPAGRHDDQVDATVYGLERLRGLRTTGGGLAGVVWHGRPPTDTDDQAAHDAEKRRRRYAREAARELEIAGYRDPRETTL